jgi:hypothetical protein
MTATTDFATRSLFVAACLAVTATAAEASQMTGKDIKTEIIGRAVFLAAPIGGEFPLNYYRNGRVDGNGTALGLGKFLAPKDSGKWWIKGNNLCQQFKVWYDGEPMCFTLTRTGENAVRWLRDNGENGSARIGKPLP